MLAQEFKINDKVYCPLLGNKIYILMKDNSENASDEYNLYILGSNITFNKNGFSELSTKVPLIFHVNDDTRDKLNSLYNDKYERSVTSLSTRLIIQEILKAGKKLVPCYVDDYEDFILDERFVTSKITFIEKVVGDNLVDMNGVSWKFAVPVDIDSGYLILNINDARDYLGIDVNI